MDIWNILGIGETADKEELKNAYRNRLKTVNPEDDPEGFKELRAAYEEALRLSESPEKEEEIYSGAKGLINEIYTDFQKRIDVNAWKELFDSDYFVALDSSQQSIDILMNYLSAHIHMPHRVWKIIVDALDIEENRREFSERYSFEFIDYIINNSKFTDLINYDLFDGDDSLFDRYIDLFYRLDLAMRRYNPNEADRYMEELEELEVYHPYLDAVKLKREMARLTYDASDEDKKKVVDTAKDLYALFPEDEYIATCMGDAYMFCDNLDMAQTVFDKCAVLSDNSYISRGKLAELAYKKGEYAKARDIYLDLLRINHYDNSVRLGMLRANASLIEENKKKLLEDGAGNRTRFEIAWSHYQCYQFADALGMLEQIKPEDSELCEYNNLKGRTLLCLKRYEEALNCFFAWKTKVEELSAYRQNEATEDEYKELDKKIVRYPYINFLIADCYIKLKKYAEAKSYLQAALEKEHDEIVLAYEANCELMYKSGEYDRCLEACDMLLERDNRSYISYIFRARACEKLGYLEECIKACERAKAIYPYTAESYVLEIRLCKKSGQPESAQKILDSYKTFKIDSDSMAVEEARLMFEKGCTDDALKLLNKVEERYDGINTDLQEPEEMYILLGDCYDAKNNPKLAEKYYTLAIKADSESKNGYGRLAEIYKKTARFAKALDMYKKQIEIEPHPVYYINMGLINRYLESYNEAIKNFESALFYDPQNAYCYSRLGLIYEQNGQYNQAIENYRRALEHVGDNNVTLKEEILVYLARTYQCINSFEEAVEIYKELFRAKPDNPDLAYDYGLLLYRTGDMEKAQQLLRRVIENYDSNKNDYIYKKHINSCIRLLCRIYGEYGYVGKAFECFELGAEFFPEDCRIHAAIAKVFYENGNLYEAEKYYTEACRLDKGNKENYYSNLIEVIKSKKGLIKGDIKKLIPMAALDEKRMRYPFEYLKLSRLYRNTNQYDKALRMTELALSKRRCQGCFYGCCYKALYEKALILEALKQYDKALEILYKATEVFGYSEIIAKKIEGLKDK